MLCLKARASQVCVACAVAFHHTNTPALTLVGVVNVPSYQKSLRERAWQEKQEHIATLEFAKFVAQREANAALFARNYRTPEEVTRGGGSITNATLVTSLTLAWTIGTSAMTVTIVCLFVL